MKQILNIAVVATALFAMAGVASAAVAIPAAPDACSTSLLFAAAFGGLGILRRFMR